MLPTLRARINQAPLLKHFIKFCIVGGSAAALNFTIYYLLVARLDVWYVVAAVWAYALSAIFNFFANKFWTFRHPAQGRAMIRQVGKFAIVLGSGMLINTILIYIGTDFLGFDYRVSWVVATGLVTFWNFAFNRLWTFRHVPASSAVAGSPGLGYTRGEIDE